jgi:hypothetical protein
MHLHDSTVDIVATLRPWYRNPVVEGQPCRIDGLDVRIVVSRHVEQRHVEAGDEILEIVEWKVSTRDDEVRPERLKLVPIEIVVDFVRDR